MEGRIAAVSSRPPHLTFKAYSEVEKCRKMNAFAVSGEVIKRRCTQSSS